MDPAACCCGAFVPAGGDTLQRLIFCSTCGAQTFDSQLILLASQYPGTVAGIEHLPMPKLPANTLVLSIPEIA